MLPASEIPALSFTGEGKGPLVIMLHGLLMDGNCWKKNGMISLFSSDFHVVCPDLLGHGRSEKTPQAKCYTPQNQALSILRIMDELGYKKAHIIGYSSGAWLALALLNHHPERVESVVFGGWDFINGLPETPDGKLTFEMFMSFAKCTAPELISGLSLNEEESIRCFFNELRAYSEKKESLFPYKNPILFWAGTDDPYYASMADLAERHTLPMVCGKGDHLGEVNRPDKTSTDKILTFIKEHQFPVFFNNN